MAGLFSGDANYKDEFTSRNENLAKTGGLSMFQDLKTDFFGGDNTPRSTYASDTFARLTRDRWAQYVKTFVPIENQLIDYATNPNTVSNAMSSASGNVQDSFNAQQGAMARRLQGLGLTLNADEQGASNRESSLNRGLADVQAQNLARDETVQRQQQILGNPAPDIARAASTSGVG